MTKQAAPLHLLFNTYYVPPGFFSRLVTTLLNKPNFRVAFSKGVYRDRIVLLYGDANSESDEITLTKCKSSIEIQVIRTESRLQECMLFSCACHKILCSINDCFPTILHWLKGITPQYAFVCEQCTDSDLQHYMEISFTNTKLTKTVHAISLHCDNFHSARLTPSQREWLLFHEEAQVYLKNYIVSIQFPITLLSILEHC